MFEKSNGYTFFINKKSEFPNILIPRLHVPRIPQTENGATGKRQLPFVCCRQKMKTANFHLFAENGNGKRKFVSLGRQTINSSWLLLFQQMCPSMVVSQEKGNSLLKNSWAMGYRWEYVRIWGYFTEEIMWEYYNWERVLRDILPSRTWGNITSVNTVRRRILPRRVRLRGHFTGNILPPFVLYTVSK